MLQFFRRYQKFFFLFTTVIIVISFTFFGTYQSFVDAGPTDKTAFYTTQGTAVSQYDLDEMVMFLSTDAYDNYESPGIWGTNFLNDGVLRHDFIEAGLARALAERHLDEIAEELEPRQRQERSYRAYVHPHAKFVGAESAWSYFAPALKASLDKVRTAPATVTMDSFDNRVRLFLAETAFPASTLRQLLAYQQNQYDWLPADPNLPYQELRLFGYNGVYDWFGQTFVQLAAKFIFNSAEEAAVRGHEVTRAEALASLRRQAQLAMEANRDPGMVLDADAMMNEQLRLMSMDRSRAVSLWQKVLLSRRLFEQAADAIFVDGLPYEQFGAYAREGRSITRYALPGDLQLAGLDDLMAFQAYVEAVDAGGGKGLMPPSRYLSAATLAKSAPELVQRRYRVGIRSANLGAIEASIGVKETWEWEMRESSWQQLSDHFAELKIATTHDADSRFTALEALEPAVRAKVDAFARKQIVASRPALLENALKSAPEKEQLVSIALAGGALPFVGVGDREVLIAALERAELAEMPAEGSSLHQFSGDGIHIYQIRVLARSEAPEVLSFREAKSSGALASLVTRRLDEIYPQIRSAAPETFRGADGRWRPVSEVRKQVVEAYLKDVVARVCQDADVENSIEAAAQHRFRSQLMAARQAMLRGEAVDTWLAEEKQATAAEGIPSRFDLKKQWGLVASEQMLRRSDADSFSQQAFELEVGSWSAVGLSEEGNVGFFRVDALREADVDAFVAQKMDEARELLGREAKGVLGRELLDLFDAHAALQEPQA